MPTFRGEESRASGFRPLGGAGGADGDLAALRAWGQDTGEGVGHRGRLVDRGAGQQNVLPAARHDRWWREDAPDALAVGPRANVDARWVSVDDELRGAPHRRRERVRFGAEIKVAAGRAALGLDLRHSREVDARAARERLERRDRVVAVGVDDDEGERVGKPCADAHGVFVALLFVFAALPARGKAHALLAVDVRALEREERDSVRAVEALGLREHARHFFCKK